MKIIITYSSILMKEFHNFSKKKDLIYSQKIFVHTFYSL